MAYEESSGLYYDFKSGYYFDAQRSLYYDGNSGTYYSYNYEVPKMTTFFGLLFSSHLHVL
jgi:hypothetical protein